MLHVAFIIPRRACSTSFSPPAFSKTNPLERWAAGSKGEDYSLLAIVIQKKANLFQNSQLLLALGAPFKSFLTYLWKFNIFLKSYFTFTSNIWLLYRSKDKLWPMSVYFSSKVLLALYYNSDGWEYICFKIVNLQTLFKMLASFFQFFQ